MHSITKIAASIAAAAMLAAVPARAGTLDTDVDIALPSAIALYCYDEVDVDISAENFLTAVGDRTENTTLSASRNARASSGRLRVSVPRRPLNRASRTRVNLILTGVCAFRASGINRSVRVSVNAKENRLLAAGGSSIRVRNLRARDAAKGGGWRRRYNVRRADLGWSTLRGIDVRMQLDMRRAKEPGSYSSATDGTFEIVVVPNP